MGVGGRMPSEINSVIRTHVLNDDSSMSVCLLTVAENTFKSTIIPEHKFRPPWMYAFERIRIKARKIWYNENELIQNTNS